MIKFIISILSIIVIACGCVNEDNSVSEDESLPVAEYNDYKLCWNDEFNYNGLPDSTKWGYDTEGNETGWGNNEAQHYTYANEKNARVENGILYITAHKENFEGKEYKRFSKYISTDEMYQSIKRVYDLVFEND